MMRVLCVFVLAAFATWARQLIRRMPELVDFQVLELRGPAADATVGNSGSQVFQTLGKPFFLSFEIFF